MNKTSYLNPGLPLEERVAALLGVLTMDEKLSLCAGQNFWETRAIPRLGLKPFRMTDGPRGVAFHSSTFKRCTAFPSGIAQAASWDRDLMGRFGEAIAQETKAVGARCILGPAINITRTPLNGRTFEYFSEDPLLNSQLAVPMIKGVQKQGVAACVKHFAANNQESNRMRNSSEVSERALQEIYLPAFRASVEQADAWSIMAAYNAVNGVAACENADLLQGKLRDEYGFRGFVVSDWFAVRRTTSSEAVVKAGLNLEMPGKGSRLRYRNVKKSFDQGKFSEAELDENLRGLLRVMVLTGHLDPEPGTGERNTAGHQLLARQMAEAGITLLKNDRGLLPLCPQKSKKIALLGPKLNKKNCLPLWGGSAGVWPPYEVTPLEGLKKANRERFEWVKSPAEADAVLLFVGLSHRPGGDSEAMDRKNLHLPKKQQALIESTIAVNPNTIVVLINGGPVTMPWLDDVPAVLEAWYPGMEGGSAIARVLFGDSNPSGKLPLTFPKQLEDSPAHQSERSYPGDKHTVRYEEDIFVGYRHFDKWDIEPLFPFGHGLSYTEFDYTDLRLNAEHVGVRDTLTITMLLTNTGDRHGAEVVQLYIADIQATEGRPDHERPPQSLKGFEKVQLDPGQSRQVSFELPMIKLMIFCAQSNQWQLREGRYRARLGSSSRDIRLEQSFYVASITNGNTTREAIV